MTEAKVGQEIFLSEARVRELVDYLEKWARGVLANAEGVEDADKRAFEKRLANFRESFDRFVDFIDPMRSHAVDRLNGIFMLMEPLIRDSVLLAAR